MDRECLDKVFKIHNDIWYIDELRNEINDLLLHIHNDNPVRGRVAREELKRRIDQMTAAVEESFPAPELAMGTIMFDLRKAVAEEKPGDAIRALREADMRAVEYLATEVVKCQCPKEK